MNRQHICITSSGKLRHAPTDTKVSAEAGTQIVASAVKLTFTEMRRSEWKAENNPEHVKEHPEKWLHRDGLFRTSKDHQNDPNKCQNRAVPSPLHGDLANTEKACSHFTFLNVMLSVLVNFVKLTQSTVN